MNCRFILSFVFAILIACAAHSHGQLVPPDTTEGRTQISYSEEPFVNYSGGDGGAGFVKFAIVLSDPGTVYFQDSNLYPFHFDFATQRLQPFLGMSRAQFDAVSLRRAGQQVVLGAVIFPPFDSAREFGIQFVGLDPYPKEDVKAWFDAVKEAVMADPPADAIYIPSFEQKAQAEADRAWFAERGIVVDGIERWIVSQAVYADGWAFGRLVFVPGAQIAAAYSAGTLKPTDVLLTDGVPAEVPFLAGILTLTPATPNSHVAILARNQRIPFAWIVRVSERTRIQALVGREVLMRASSTGEFSLRVSAADDDLDPQVRAQILRLKTPPVVQVKPRKHLGRLSADVSMLVPRDIKFFGGKASNFGLLRRTIPENSPRALAFSFDLWEQFLENVNPDSGLKLREEIEQRLGAFTWPPNFAEAGAALDSVRKLIRKDVKFTDGQKAAILSALTGAGFQPTRMLRFRSSSNAEDTSQFSGAGLYESFNGCIADSQDGDGDGPSHCCPDEPEEETVLGALEKVFASFYNDNAWLERLRHGIPESQVGMAVLVHENARDEDEMANGVATITRRPGFEPGRAEHEFNIVTQAGAVSVTNPEGGAKPEIVIGGQSSGFDPYLFTQQHSDLVQLGANVMTWESDYRDLLGLFVKVAKGYAQLFPEKATFTLDLEFKKLVPGVLQVKQVRELPQPRERLVKPILLNEPTEWVVFQGEFADAFAYHRLKCVLTASTLNTKLNATLAAPLHRDCSFDFVLNGALSNLGNGPFAWPGYRFLAPRPGLQLDLWKASGEASAVTYRLRSTIPAQADAAVGPVLTQRDFNERLVAIYKTPQPYLDFDGLVKTRSSDAASLIPRGELIPESALQTRRIQTPAGVVIDPQFHWPDYSDGGFVIIKTFPLAAWDHTTITGLTTSPLVLTDDFAQTYAPGHHNFTEVFLFEPALDPGITPEQRAELEAANIRMIHVFHDRALGFGDTIRVLGFDGAFRLLP